jgi:hypothetical protein
VRRTRTRTRPPAPAPALGARYLMP